MTDPLSGLLVLLIMLVGLSIMIWGKAGPGKLLGVVLAPFGCLLKIVFGLVVLVIGVLLFTGAPELPSSTGAGVPTAPPPASPPPAAAGDVLLTQYPILAQRDQTLYDPAGLAETRYWYAGSSQPVKHLACLATVYLMLERGRGEPDAMITSDSFDATYDAINPGYVEQADIAFSGQRFVSELQAGRPVVLHATGGLLGHHFLLGIGIRRGPGGSWIGIANDPWFGTRIELDLAQSAPVHPSLADTVFTKMRLVN
jgi:hypothetical protein